MNWDEYRKRVPTGKEKTAMMRFAMNAKSMDEAIDDFAERLGDYKYLKRDRAMIMSRVEAILSAGAKDIPQDIMQVIQRQAMGYELRLVKKTGMQTGSNVVMSIEDLDGFASVIIGNECAMCMKDGKDKRECEYRKLMRRYIEEPQPRYRDGCGYQTIDVNEVEK